jgi:hypothetical protein
MYASMDFPTKKDFKHAVLRGEPIMAYSPELGMPAINGKEFVHGPWPMQSAFQAGAAEGAVRRPKPFRSWVARVSVKDMLVVAVH